MASASSSTSIPQQPPTSSSYTHDVFLCFRGPDTGNGFTSHLYAALDRKGIRTYKDDKKLRIGDVISDELVKAIEESMFAVIIFSPDFASSIWCLDEVCKIMECKNKLGLQMVEVFYGVEPCDVRHQIGTFQEAFEKHKREGFHKSEKIQRWRDALKQVTAHSGWTTKNQPDEAALVESIAQHIFDELLTRKLSSSRKNLVGIESRVKQVISQIGLEFNDVRYISIWGLGGIGKTTIARAVFETIRSRFDVSCFVADVRHHSGDITRLQKELLKQISPNADYNKYDGSTIIQTSFRLKKVLIVLDDVSHENQLENLAKEKDWFGPGSRIIVTTRNKEVLKKQEGHETYEVEGLVKNEALNLFCSNAFKLLEPPEGFLDLSNEMVEYTGGLPLALKVLGSHFFGQPIKDWRSAIKDIKKFSHSDIIDVLKISYNGLRSFEKNIFLDIACFFKGYERDDVTKMLEQCGHNAEVGINILINRSLVTIDKYDRLRMHDLLEEMGKLIVIEESPDDVSKRSRLWCYNDIDSIAQKQEIEATQSIVLPMPWWSDAGENWRDLDIRGSSFSKLQLLILHGVKAPIICNIPCTLKVLRWRYCPMETLSFTDHQHYELVEIDLSHSEIVQLWDGKKFLNKLEHLNLSYCKKLKETPDLSGARNLKTLNLDGCLNLNYIHPSLTQHKSLVELNLEDCSSLKTLGDKFEMSSLKKLNLLECPRLRRLPEFGECMKQLSILTLELEDVQNTDVLLSSVSLLTSLSSLKLIKCFPKSEESIPYYDLGHLAFLTELDLSLNHFKRVPISIHRLPKLTRLHLNYCFELEVLPDLSSSLRVLRAIGCVSLDASNVNDVISKACCVFAESSTQDGEDVFEMVIPGKEIPAWFDHQEQGNGVSVSFSHNCPSTNTMTLSLSFVFDGHTSEPSVICCNGKEFINKRLFKRKLWEDWKGNTCIVFLNGYYFSNLLGQHNRFHILFPGNTDYNTRVTRSAARWVCKQDIQDFKKRTLEMNMGFIPLYEEKEERAATAEGAIRSDPPELLPLFPLLPVSTAHSSHSL